LARGKLRKTNCTRSPYFSRSCRIHVAYSAQNGHWKSEYSITVTLVPAGPKVMSDAATGAAVEGLVAAAPVKR